MPSVAYSYSFEPNPDWSQAYAEGGELKAYIDHYAYGNGVMPTIPRAGRWPG